MISINPPLICLHSYLVSKEHWDKKDKKIFFPSQLGTKLKDAVVWYVPKKAPYRSAQRATTNSSKIGQTNYIPQILSI